MIFLFSSWSKRLQQRRPREHVYMIFVFWSVMDIHARAPPRKTRLQCSVSSTTPSKHTIPQLQCHPPCCRLLWTSPSWLPDPSLATRSSTPHTTSLHLGNPQLRDYKTIKVMTQWFFKCLSVSDTKLAIYGKNNSGRQSTCRNWPLVSSQLWIFLYFTIVI